jgi:hopanoid C-3 methylase
MIWKLDGVYNAYRQYAEHQRPVRYLLPRPAPHPVTAPDRKELYIHAPVRRKTSP